MTAIDDHLVQSENHATDAVLSMRPGDPLRSAIQAQLALTSALHAHTLAISTPAKAPAISVAKLAGAIRDGYRAAPSPVDHEEYIARFVLSELHIEAVA